MGIDRQHLLKFGLSPDNAWRFVQIRQALEGSGQWRPTRPDVLWFFEQLDALREADYINEFAWRSWQSHRPA